MGRWWLNTDHFERFISALQTTTAIRVKHIYTWDTCTCCAVRIVQVIQIIPLSVWI